MALKSQLSLAAVLKRWRKEVGVTLCVYTLFQLCNSSLSIPGLSMEGLYRVPGMKSEILRIKKEFDRGTLWVAC